jgi:hypothetical protein
MGGENALRPDQQVKAEQYLYRYYKLGTEPYEIISDLADDEIAARR